MRLHFVVCPLLALLESSDTTFGFDSICQFNLKSLQHFLYNICQSHIKRTKRLSCLSIESLDAGCGLQGVVTTWPHRWDSSLEWNILHKRWCCSHCSAGTDMVLKQLGWHDQPRLRDSQLDLGAIMAAMHHSCCCHEWTLKMWIQLKGTNRCIRGFQHKPTFQSLMLLDLRSRWIIDCSANCVT